ncbi:glycosyltransferase family 2 protein [Alloscardovia omnicolens]|uniref:glycosyltransferase family 2 protein n=1 Tax=Alloscardovia omnicolens TaxID=419015 RepID=UPI00242E9167|nr:glycosyltransferase family 2 protein [Alloscardovia omnicolens]MBS6347027.1 glycosyltransferase family 2 protein [Alloscardovia omnicolens]MDK6249443.1 glycosyltransferase family 2 protein [Alloscardovia omnicolens]
MNGLLSFLDLIITILGVITIVYQVGIVIVGMLVKPQTFRDVPQNRRYAVLISARNEEAVIGNLIRSIHNQTYPQELIDTWIVADNCTDNTAQLARSLGCHVIERFNQTQVGKGYALQYLLRTMMATGDAKNYDAFFIFDADNLLDKNYIAEMNKAHQAGFEALTSYRNSVNLADNWVSSGAALWFVRESRFLNVTRVALGTSCHVGGTGFMFSRRIMERNDGWKFHLLTEDMEFSMDCILHGDRIGFCGSAMFFDEQPVDFKTSWTQRVRWSKGYLEVFRYYGKVMLQWAIKERDFSAIDMTLMVCPFMVISLIRFVLGIIYAVLGYISWFSISAGLTGWISSVLTSFVGMMLLAAFSGFVERDKLNITLPELMAYSLSFPIYMASYVPIAFVAIFSKSQWKPIAHAGGSAAEQIMEEGSRSEN